MINNQQVDAMIADVIRRAELTLAGRDGPLLPDPREDIRAVLDSARLFQTTLRAYLENPDAYGGSIIHDLRGRLNSVTGFSEMLIDDTGAKLNSNQRQEIASIYQTGLQLRDYVNTHFRSMVTR